MIYKGTSGKDSSGGPFVRVHARPARRRDINDDAYIDVLYAGDVKGQLWKIDLTPDLSGATTRGKLASGKATYFPLLLYDAGARSGCLSPCWRPFYMEPTVVLTSVSSSGAKTLGVAIGSGQRADLLDNTANTQRFYFMVDSGATRTESDLVGFNVGDATPARRHAQWLVPELLEHQREDDHSGAGPGWLSGLHDFPATDRHERSLQAQRVLPALRHQFQGRILGARQARYQDIATPGVALGMSDSINLKGEILAIIQEQGSGLLGESFGLTVSTTIRDWKER